jgi:hypothetical protein
MKKILVSDFDGTFLLNDEDIIKNIEKVEEFRKQGNIFIIATGRSNDEFKEALSKYPLTYDYLIINNGATILNKDHKFLSNCIIKNWVKKSLLKKLELSAITNIYGCTILNSKIDVNNKRLTKIHIEYSSLEEAKKISNFINKKYKLFLKSFVIVSRNSVEIISSKCNKAKSVQKIARAKKINKKDIYAIGDSYNDLDMIKKFNGYTMENGKDELKAISLSIFPSVSDLIEKLLII